MSTVTEFESAIQRLPRDEFWRLTDKLIALRDEEWDRQIEQDAKTGKLDKLREGALADISVGRVKPLDELLNDQ